MTGNTSPEATVYDVIVIGAGHNGLAAATVMAREGMRVLVLEKNDYVGGMGGTREILSGCRNEVGASVLFPLSTEVKDYFDFEGHGVEFIPLPIMALNLTGLHARPMIFYRNQFKQLWHILRDFGPGALLGFIRLMKFCAYPARMLDRFTARQAPRTLQQILDGAPDAQHRRQLELAFNASAMDVIDLFFPDPIKHMELRANLAFAATQSTYKGPYTPGSALCLVYTMAQEGSSGLMQRVRGGMGKLSEALATQIEQHGGEVRLKHNVKRILVEDNRAIGVQLKSGDTIYARFILSNLDKPATFNHLLADHALPEQSRARVDATMHRGAYVHMLFKLDRLPEFAPQLSWLDDEPCARFGGAMVFEPEEMQRCFEQCQRGELPKKLPVAYQFPSLMDSSLAPQGFHIASAYGFYFPCEAPRELRGKLRDQVAQRVIDQIDEYFPGFHAAIVEKAVFSSDHFAAMHGATNGDFTHGLIHPEQMLTHRSLADDSAHATPIRQFYLCGSSCHPGPGVTFLPGYNCGHEVLAAWRAQREDQKRAATSAPLSARRESAGHAA
jgi:phytoene dehydrogenase-like protein